MISTPYGSKKIDKISILSRNSAFFGTAGKPYVIYYTISVVLCNQICNNLNMSGSNIAGKTLSVVLARPSNPGLLEYDLFFGVAFLAIFLTLLRSVYNLVFYCSLLCILEPHFRVQSTDKISIVFLSGILSFFGTESEVLAFIILQEGHLSSIACKPFLKFVHKILHLRSISPCHVHFTVAPFQYTNI